ncbi:hypothetical protein [Longispora albida]|nr:hypothetical protein [Longispora albida]
MNQEFGQISQLQYEAMSRARMPKAAPVRQGAARAARRIAMWVAKQAQ